MRDQLDHGVAHKDQLEINLCLYEINDTHGQIIYMFVCYVESAKSLELV